VLSILSVNRDDYYNYILTSVIHSYFLHSLVSFDQGFVANVIIKDKQEEFTA
jgi:hypothetical protein